MLLLLALRLAFTVFEAIYFIIAGTPINLFGTAFLLPFLLIIYIIYNGQKLFGYFLLGGSVIRLIFFYATVYEKLPAAPLREVYSGGAYEVDGLGSQGRVTMIRQPDRSRYCMNMTYAIPVRRGNAEIIEDITPVYNVRVTLRVAESVKRVWLGLSGEELATERVGDAVLFTVPKIDCHTAVVIEY
jgi:hypothetical protein